MPILRFDDAPEFELAGARVRGLASPSRGATETTMYRVELGPGLRLQKHTHDHEEVFHVLEGSATAVLDGVEQLVAAGDTGMIPPGVEHYAFTGEGGTAVFLATMPTGTVMIRPDGERLLPPWAE